MYVNVLNLLVAGILTEVLLMRTMVDIKVVQWLDAMKQPELLGLNWIIGCGPAMVFWDSPPESNQVFILESAIAYSYSTPEELRIEQFVFLGSWGLSEVSGFKYLLVTFVVSLLV